MRHPRSLLPPILVFSPMWLLPIAPPLIPETHPVRSNIMARSATDLYSRIVKDMRTPAVPINLAHMMNVIVQGWKDEGNWPPRGSAATTTVNSIVLRDTGSMRGDGARGLLSGHKHLRQGVESVRRVLRLSGTAAPPGD